MARLRDDAGAVAILVALSVSTFLLGFAALAVDFGQVYTRQGELQSVADAVALAGATELPDVADARRKAVETLCSPANRLGDWPAATCPANPDDAGWTRDGTQANGEILFYGEPDDLGEISAPPLGPTATRATAIQVKLPPSTVTFGLARTFGADDLSVTKAATARVGTPIGTGFLPFAVTTQDLTDDSRNRQFCVSDPDVAGGPGPGDVPEPTDENLSIVAHPLLQQTSGDTLTIRPRFGFFASLPTTSPMFVVIDGHRIESTVHDEDQAQVTVDVNLSGGPHTVWLEAGTPRTFVSEPTTFFVFGFDPGDPAGTGDACNAPDPHGVLDIARRQVLSANDTLSANIKQGIEPTPHRVMDRPNRNPALTIPGVTAALIGTRSCDEGGLLQAVLGVVFQVLASVLGEEFEPHINCVDTRNSGFEAGLRSGLLDTTAGSPGRLLRRCSNDTVSADGVTIDGTDLQQVSDRDALPIGQDIDDVIENGQVARGAITAKAFQCPRLGIVPVINPGQSWPDDGQYPILDFVYVWIQDDLRGLSFEDGGDRLRAVKFWIIDPQFFGRTVSGSPKVGPYLGTQFPREVLLIKNPGED
jgi:hypothetical protein